LLLNLNLEGEMMVKTTANNRNKSMISQYDVAKHLRTPEEMAAYLDAWLEQAPDDVSGIARALGDIARAEGMSLVAQESG
jgi:probable addiction module antidote protein